jgi:methionine-rich copper-binding protein CopC
MRTHRAARGTRHVAVVVSTVTLLLLVGYGVGPASAHATLVGASPADGSTVRSAPATVTLRFDENIRTPSVVIVEGPDGKRVDHGTTKVLDNTASVPVHVEASGAYTVAFRVVSADGHPVAARTSFTYRGAGGGTASAGPPKAASTPSGSGGFTRWVIVGVAAALVAAGGLLLAGRTGRSETRR